MGYQIIQSSFTAQPPLVFDIRGASQQSGAVLQVHNKISGAPNQQWEFRPAAGEPEYYYIVSELDQHFIVNNAKAGQAIAGITVESSAPEQAALWRFVLDPEGSGACFIQSKLDGLVIDIDPTPPQSGYALCNFPVKPKGANASQLWKAAFPSVVKLPSVLKWENLGTGTGTAGSGGNECSYTVSLQIQQDGQCSFSGSYTNRGDVPIETAPPQDFGVAIVVQTTEATGFSFSYGGFVMSAPQENCTIPWAWHGPSHVIADNWATIAIKNEAIAGYNNQETVGQGPGGNAASASDVDAIWALLNGAVELAKGAYVGSNFNTTPSTIFILIGALPYSEAAGYDGPPIGVVNPPRGWVPGEEISQPAAP